MSCVTNIHVDIIIVGAGAAGIGAARWLTDNMAKLGRSQSSKVHVVEARNRVGGRVFTYEKHSKARGIFDLGASWIHDPPTNPLMLIAKNMKLKTVETDFDDGIVYDMKGKVIGDSKLERAFKKYERTLFTAAASAHQNSTYDSSIESVLLSNLKDNVAFNHLFMSGLEFELCTSLRNCSLRGCIDADWVEAVHGVGDSNSEHMPSYDELCDMILPRDGMSRLISGIASGEALRGTNMYHSDAISGETTEEDCIPLSIAFNEEVISIDQTNPESVVITVKQYKNPYQDPVLDTANADSNTVTDRQEIAAYKLITYTAKVVIITVPIGVLQSSAMTFLPTLSEEKLNAIQSIGFGNVVKVVMEFPSVFWAVNQPFLSIADASLANERDRGLLTYFLNGHHLAGTKFLVGYGLGDAADILDQMSDEELQALILTRLSALALPGRRASPPSRTVRTRWSQDPYARGVYSYWRPDNQPGIRAELAQREGCVFFAEEAVHESSLLSASVHGAWLSGVSAGTDVCDYLDIPVVLPKELQML